MKEQPGSASVVQGITEDRFGIGYSGIGYRTSGVKAVPLGETDEGPVLGRQLRGRDRAASIRSGGSSTST